MPLRTQRLLIQTCLVNQVIVDIHGDVQGVPPSEPCGKDSLHTWKRYRVGAQAVPAHHLRPKDIFVRSHVSYSYSFP